MKKSFTFSILIHGMLGTVLFALYEPALKSETAQPIWITLVESENGLPPARATHPPRLTGRQAPTLPRTETVLPSPEDLTPEVFQEPSIEPATKENHETGELPSPTPAENHNAGGGNDVTESTYKIAYNFNIQGSKFNEFVEGVRLRIDQAKRYPWFARLRGIEGRTQVRFRILPSGEPAEIEVVQSSQSRVLDQEAIATVKRAARFPQPPMASNLGVVVRLPLVFHLEGGTLIKE